MNQPVQLINMLNAGSELRLDVRSEMVLLPAFVRKQDLFERRSDVNLAFIASSGPSLPRRIDGCERVAIHSIKRAALPEQLSDAAKHWVFGQIVLLLHTDHGDVSSTGQVASIEHRDESFEHMVGQWFPEKLIEAYVRGRIAV